MSSPKNYVILFLALTTAAGAGLAWQQYQDLIKLRAAALTNDERADWQKKLWAAEKRRHELEDALAAAQARDGEDREGGSERATAANGETPRRRRSPGNMGATFMAMMEKPEMQKLMAIQQRSALDARYAALFKALNLSPDQLEKFKNLLVEKQTSIGDVMAAARAQGVDPRSDPQGFRKLISDEQADIDSNIKTAIGDTAFTQYQQYQQTQPQRTVVTQLEQSLSYTGAPLTQAQSDQMVQILAQTGGAPSASANNRAAIAGNFGIGFGGNGPAAPITDAAITQAQSVLSSAQVDALRQLQQAQQAQTQITQAMRNQFGGQNRAAPAQGAPAAQPGG